MISVNELIQQAFTRTGLVGEGQAANGTKAKSALHELNDLIQSLNQQEYISDNLKVYDVRAFGSITIGPGKGYEIQCPKPPSHIKSILRKSGDKFVELVPSNLEAIHAHGKNHLATQFTYSVEYDANAKILESKRIRPDALIVEYYTDLPEIGDDGHSDEYQGFHFYCTSDNSGGYCAGVTGDERGTIYAWVRRYSNVDDRWLDNYIYEYDLGCMKGSITLDANHSNSYKVIYIQEIPEYGLDDSIFLQDVYKSMLLAGLTYKLAIRYKLQEWIATYKDDFDEQKSLIKRINQTNRNLTWFNKCSSYMDSYYNGMAGGDW